MEEIVDQLQLKNVVDQPTMEECSSPAANGRSSSLASMEEIVDQLQWKK